MTDHRDADGPAAFPAGLPAGLCCPDCKGPLGWAGQRGRCLDCNREVALWGGAIPDFLGDGDPAAGAILGWPDEFADAFEPPLLALLARRPVTPSACAELAERGLADLAGGLTPLGEKLAYHLTEYRRQEGGDRIDNFLGADTPGPGSEVLDVGCGAGQTLRLLATRDPAGRVGLDTDLEALMLGRRLAGSPGRAPDLVRATAQAIPFCDGRFTHVLCRVALNYMHQGRAVGEMTRVLRPGGSLYCRVEGRGST
ncbi:MAG: class I SAM-dependent methyltransferase [Singulisphaera sp.]